MRGWRLVPDPYDDGEDSGTLTAGHPGAPRRKSAGSIDIVVGFTRPIGTGRWPILPNWSNYLTVRGVLRFPITTQSFNTTTSMGRLDLNVLLSFAQFEREVIGSGYGQNLRFQAQGIWVGGPVPLVASA